MRVKWVSLIKSTMFLYINIFKYASHRGNNKTFAANHAKVSTFNEYVLGNERTMTSHILRLVYTPAN